MITYRRGNDLDLDAVLDCYRACSLGVRRPLDDRERMAAMLANAGLVVSAWEGDRLVGLARSLTDSVHVTYLADLLVRESRQGYGIGRRLIEETRAAVPDTMLVLIAAPAAESYYPRLGMAQHPSAWTIKAGEPLGCRAATSPAPAAPPA